MRYIWVVEYTEIDKNNWVALEMHNVKKVAEHEMKLLERNAEFSFRIVKYVPEVKR
jgi:hypothetical protein